MTDFFAVGHDILAQVNSLAVIVNPQSALNCYWPMPFKNIKHKVFSVNLPSPPVIIIYNRSGNFVQTLDHDDPHMRIKNWNSITPLDKPFPLALFLSEWKIRRM